MRSLYAHNYFVFHSIFMWFVALQTTKFIYNLLPYILDKFKL